MECDKPAEPSKRSCDDDARSSECSHCGERMQRGVSIDRVLRSPHTDESFCTYRCARDFHIDALPPTRTDLIAVINAAFAPYIE